MEPGSVQPGSVKQGQSNTEVKTGHVISKFTAFVHLCCDCDLGPVNKRKSRDSLLSDHAPKVKSSPGTSLSAEAHYSDDGNNSNDGKDEYDD